MNEKQIKLQIEAVVNKLLYSKEVIEKNSYEETVRNLDKLLFEEQTK